MNYEIFGEPMPAVICKLDAGESMITESGSMSWMTPNMQMQTKGGGIGKMFSKAISGESMFQNIYTATNGAGEIAFTSSFPGNIMVVEVTPDKPIIAQKSAFLAGTSGIELSIFFQKKLGAGLFGGEGFIMQKISGTGLAFLEIDGSAREYELAVGEKMVLDTGYLAMADASVSIDIERIKGVKNMFFGGEGLFNTVVTGPGKITLQTMPMASFIGMIASKMPSSSD